VVLVLQRLDWFVVDRKSVAFAADLMPLTSHVYLIYRARYAVEVQRIYKHMLELQEGSKVKATLHSRHDNPVACESCCCALTYGLVLQLLRVQERIYF
jgi:hypothetical protein